ncbi:MAG TPA: RNA pseudouridine synthase [Clostridiales bacterium]|nr:RNA pseudouridine synthase [Clostridiales bacterium]
MNRPNILYEDNHIIVAVKPRNMPSQADSSGDMDFLSGVREYVRVTYNKPGKAYLGLVHRLDRPAGGVMVFARTSKAAARLAGQMRRHTFEKDYLVVTRAGIPKAGTLKDWLLKDSAANRTRVAKEGEAGAKYAELSYRVAGEKEGLALLKIRLVTGRSHQIRVQLSHMGAPLVGDVKYGGSKNDTLCLWAWGVRFLHPTRQTKMEFYYPPPAVYPWNLFGIVQ